MNSTSLRPVSDEPGVLLGRHFLFVGGADTALNDRARGYRARGRTLPLWGERYELDRAIVEGPAPLELGLACVTTDKDVYREGDDAATIVIIDPARPDEEVSVQVLLAGRPFRELKARLDWNGMAVRTIHDLVAGVYEVRQGSAQTKFEVAAYSLAPMTASARETVLTADGLQAKLDLSALSRPVSGRVRVVVLENGKPVHGPVELESIDGVLDATFPLQGEGPFVAHVTGIDDPGLDAQIPLRGTAKQERKLIWLARLGAEYAASVLKLEGGQACRGLWIREEGRNNAPVKLDQAIAEVGRLEARVLLHDVVLTVVHPGERRVSHRVIGTLAPGQSVEFGVQAPWTLALIGGFAGDRPWEGMASLLPPSDVGLEIDVPARTEPRATLPVTLRTARPRGESSVFLVVRDARLKPMDHPLTRLGAGLKDAIEKLEQHLPALTVLPSTSRQPRSPLFVAPRPVSPGARQKLGEMLVANGYINSAQQQEALARQKQTGKRIGQIFMEMGVVTERDITQMLSIQLSVPFLDLDAYVLDPVIVKLVPEHIAQRHQVIAINKVGQRLSIAMVDPLNVLALDDIHLMTGLTTRPVIATPTAIQRALQDTYGAQSQIDRVFGDIQCCEDDRSDEEQPIGEMDGQSDIQGSIAPEALGKSVGMPIAVKAPGPVRDRFPEVVFAGLVHVRGHATVDVRLGDALGRLEIDAFVMHRGDWEGATRSVEVVRETFADLTVPELAHPKDRALGRLDVGWSSSPVQIQLTCDGRPVALSGRGQPFDPARVTAAGRETLSFPLTPGQYECVVREVSTGRADRSSRLVTPPGTFRGLARTVRVLMPGARLSADDATALSLRVLPGPTTPFRELCEVTAGFEHLCCEQTAAKIMAAMGAYLVAPTEAERQRLESIVYAGVERERLLWMRGKGLKLYPQDDRPNLSWGKVTVERLLALPILAEQRGLPPALKDALAALDEIGRDCARPCGVELAPSAARTSFEGYRGLVAGSMAPLAVAQAARQATARFAAGARGGHGEVLGRVEACHAAAALLRIGTADCVTEALALVDWVGRQRGANGGYYSTHDSAAAITMLHELSRLALLGGAASRVRVDGTAMRVEEALKVEEIDTLEAMDAPVLVEVGELRHEDWTAFKSNLPVSVKLVRSAGDGPLAPGDRARLELSVEAYRDGDLAHVCLPPALARVHGGGRVQAFSVDFAGKASTAIEVAVVGGTTPLGGPHRQHYFACVRNMFEAERIGNPGLLEVALA